MKRNTKNAKYLHWCAGDVYLCGFENLDHTGILASSITLEENHNFTTIDRYYNKPFSTKFAKRERRPFIVDKRADILKKWKYKDKSVYMILMISAIEHFTKKDAQFIVSEAYRVLEKGGEFILDFPDIKAQVEEYYYKDPEWMTELIYCNQKDQYSVHHWGYTPKTIKTLFGKKWDVTIDKDPTVVHNYPMICARARKL